MESEIPAAGGITGALIRSIDWGATPVGPIATWPPSLLTTVEILLNTRHPMFLWWGPDLIQFYNDAYMPSFGDGRHPSAMGQRGVDCWQDIWSIIEPQIAGVIATATAVWFEDAHVPIWRNRRLEEVYWTYSYSPVFDEARRVGGVVVICTETTSRVIANRRQHLLGTLAERTAAVARADDVIAVTLQTLAAFPEDVPFATFFAADGSAPLVHAVSHADATPLRDRASVTAPVLVNLPAPLAVGPWEPVTTAYAIPLGDRGVLLFGLSARLPFDDPYRELLAQVVEHARAAFARHVSFAVRARAEVERRNLLMQAPVATAILTGPHHVFELANPLYIAMVGRAVVGMTYADAFPELRTTALSGILDDVYRTGVPYVAHELLVPFDRVGAGTPQACYFKFTLQPIRDPDDVVFGMMVVAIDITEVVTAREAQAALVTELEAASRSKDEFLAMLGHELRNPLSPIVTALQLLRARSGDDLPEEIRVIDRQILHVNHLVDDLLDVSRITRGKLELSRSALDLGRIIATAIEMARPLIEERRHQLTVVTPSVAYYGDATRLAQVVANLLTNAARYSPVASQIEVALSLAPDGSATISVIDHGDGISAALLPRIFDVFVQGDRSVDRSQGGLGLGLALVKTLITLHGGTVEVTSAGLGRGSEFVVRLPAIEIPQPAVVTPTPEARPVARSILIVDDNVDAGEMLGELLRMKGHRVEFVTDPITALATLATFQPEIAILDIGLPVLDGYELARRFATTNPACYLIALTGYGREGDRVRALAAGFGEHLVKPVRLDRLTALIADVP